jgi:hypothetical protein
VTIFQDAAAFLALSAAQRERAGQLSQAQLDEAIQKSLLKGTCELLTAARFG